jgi:hypothetical protein
VIEQPAHVLHSGRTVDSSAHGLRVDYAEISSRLATTSLVLGAVGKAMEPSDRWQGLLRCIEPWRG